MGVLSIAMEDIAINVSPSVTVPGVMLLPPGATACFVFAHGAGAGMTHPFMAAVATGLAERRIGSLRYQFPYMERGSRRPDSPALAQATVRAAVNAATRRCPRTEIYAGGKSYGGRMTSQAQAIAPLDQVRGLVFLGFPLHPANKPSSDRGRHLFDVHVPMLFLQGSRDRLAEGALLKNLVQQLGVGASLHEIAGADHSFHVPSRSGRSDDDVMGEMLDAFAAWIKTQR